MIYYIFTGAQRSNDEIIQQLRDVYYDVEIGDINDRYTLHFQREDENGDFHTTVKFFHLNKGIAMIKINQEIASLICEDLIFDN